MSQQTFVKYQYSCECGKEFSGEAKKTKMLVKMHHKRCIFTKTNNSNSVYIESNRQNSHIKINGHSTPEVIQKYFSK